MKSILKRDQVQLDESERRRPVRGPATPGACAPAGASARLVRLDEHTQAIEFTCACGEVSLIEIQPSKKP